MLRLMTVASLCVLTSGCLGIGVVGLVPTKSGVAVNAVNNPINTKPGTTTPSTTTPTRSGDVPTVTPTPTPTTSGPSAIVQRFIGTWLAEDTSTGLDRVTFSKYPAGATNVTTNGGVVEAAFQGQRVSGEFVVNGNQIILMFDGESPAAHDFSFLADGRLRIGQALYRK